MKVNAQNHPYTVIFVPPTHGNAQSGSKNAFFTLRVWRFTGIYDILTVYNCV